MASINQIKLTAGLEATAGTARARSKVVPIRGVVGVDRKPTTGEDPAIVGNNIASGEYLLYADTGGDIPLAIRPCGGLALLFKSLLGTESTVKQVVACLRVRYTGSSASGKITASASGNSINAKKGTLGAEANDAEFGASGTLDLTQAAQDTLGELVTVIDGYTNYEAETVFGAAGDNVSGVTNTVVDATVQAKNTWAYLWFTSATSGVYRHQFVADLSTAERPTLTLQKDGYQDNFAFPGIVVDQLTLNGALKAVCEGSATVLGFGESGGQSLSGLTLEDQQPLIFFNGGFTIGANEYTYIRNFELTIANNHSPEGYGTGTVDRLYHQRGMLAITGSMQLRLDATSFAERAKIFSNTRVAISFTLKGGDYSASIPELLVIELPYCHLQGFEWVENNGVFDCTVRFRAVKPKGSYVYNEPITVAILNQDASVYAPA